MTKSHNKYAQFTEQQLYGLLQQSDINSSDKAFIKEELVQKQANRLFDEVEKEATKIKKVKVQKGANTIIFWLIIFFICIVFFAYLAR